jgi:hypothetical protein
MKEASGFMSSSSNASILNIDTICNFAWSATPDDKSQAKYQE